MAADTALDRIERILQILPHAAREGGIGYDELAERLGTDRRQLERDLTEVMDREYYHPAGSGDDIQVGLETGRVRVWTTGALRRPTRLAPGEAAALDLGLRILAAEREEPGLSDAMRTLLDSVARAVPADLLDHVAADGDPDAGDATRALLIDAARRRLRCRIRYLKPDAEGPEDRHVEPYVVVYAEGRWYLLGRAPEHDDIRAFRVDRIIQATVGTEAFTPPADFDPADYLTGGRVYRADEEVEVVVRYTPRVAPWLIEEGAAEEGAAAEGAAGVGAAGVGGAGEPDGAGVTIRHQVADPGWVVRHVLGYGPDAVVVEPEEVRAAVREAVGALAR